MATDFTHESVLRFLCSNGGRVKNADLLTHYKKFLREDENRAQNRELFKRFLNTLATVRQEEGVSYIVLRKKFRGQSGDIGGTLSPEKTREEKHDHARPRYRDRSPKHVPVVSRNQESDQVFSETNCNLKSDNELHVPTVDIFQNADKILPSAGIVNNNNNVETINFEKPVKTSSPYAWEQPVTNTETNNGTCTLKPSPFNSESERSSGSGQSFEQSWDMKGPVEPTELEHSSVYIAKLGQSREADGCSSSSFCPPLDYLYCDITVTPPEDGRQGSTQCYGPSYRALEEPAAAWPWDMTFGNSARISSSSPCIADYPGTPHAQAYSQVSRSNGSLPRPKKGVRGIQFQEPEHGRAATPVSPQPLRRSLPLDSPYTPAGAGYTEHHHAGLSSSHSSLPMSSLEDCDWPQGFPKEEWTSDDRLNYTGLSGDEHGDRVREMLRHAHEAKLLSLMHRAERNVTPWHHSTGHLDDKESRASPLGSAPEILVRPAAHRTSHQFRSRLCRSLGADLDQPFPEDGVSARHNRLHLLSSSLSINYHFSRAHSCSDVSSHSGSGSKSLTSSTHDGAYFHRSSLVPLEPKEHDWVVKAASGMWTEIYSLFREDPSLLSKRDFISGYTVLHWIAKHGDHRVLNTLWYGVDKAGMKLDVDAKTTCGYTPLHLAAIHGHKNIIRLLVQKFKANCALRDTSGKKPWQYLGSSGPRDLLQLLGAPQWKRAGGAMAQSSAERPPGRSATASAAVKRHSSLAALFKHKSLLRVPGQSDSFV